MITYYCDPRYHYELSFCNGDVRIADIQKMPHKAIDMWLGRIFFDHPMRRTDYVACQMDLYRLVCRDAGMQCPIRSKEDLWFDWEELQGVDIDNDMDALVVNSSGQSSQCDSSPKDFERLCNILQDKGLDVWTTEPLDRWRSTKSFGMTCTEIANNARKCKFVIGVQTAPIHLTFNTFMNKDCKWGVIHQGTKFVMGDRVTPLKNLREAEQWAIKN